jgi:uncharacterized protein
MRASMTKNKIRYWIGIAALAISLSGCNAASPDASTGAPGSAQSEQSKWFDPANSFKNPQALALARAAQDNNADEVRRLIKDEHINPDTLFSDDDNEDPLVAWPVITSSLGGLKALLDNGANPNARRPDRIIKKFDDGSVLDHFKHSNAMVYAAINEDPDYLKLLLEHGGDPNTRNTNDETLLFQAYIWHNQWQNVQVLVEHGADPNIPVQGGTILYDYATEGNFKAAYWLLQHGANPAVEALLKQPPPPAPPRSLIAEAIFWYPAKPDFIDSQRQCQQWLLAHGFKRPPMPDVYRNMRKDLGVPYEEKDIPLL